MNKKILGFGVILLALFILSGGKAHAGGCCYTFFSATDGIAGVQDAQIHVGFVDPSNIFADSEKTTFNPLSNKKIEAHVLYAKPGQSCQTNSEKTNDQGNIDAHCSSPVAGSMMVYFTSSDLNTEENNMIKAVAKSVTFASNPNAPVAMTVTPAPVQDNTAKPTPTTTQTEVNDAGSETALLQERINSLEEKVVSQQKQVNALEKILNSLMDFFKSIFH